MAPKPSTSPGERLRVCLVLYSSLLRQPLLAIVQPWVEISGPRIALIPATAAAAVAVAVAGAGASGGAHHASSPLSFASATKRGGLPRIQLGAGIKVAVTTGESVRRRELSE